MIFFKSRVRVLAIGAHPDDIELGAGGLVFRLTSEKRALVDFLVLSPGIHGQRDLFVAGTRKDEALGAGKVLGARSVTVLNFSDCRLHETLHDLIKTIEGHLYDKRRKPRYDLVLVHAGADTHQDHKAVHDAALSAARYFMGTLLLYAAPSTVLHDFKPTVFVELSEKVLREKDAALMRHIGQRDKEFMLWRRTVLFAKAAGAKQRCETALEEFEICKSFWGIE